LSLVSGAIVVAENLLINIAIKVERLYRNIGSLQATLQEAPEVFDSVSVDAAPTHKPKNLKAYSIMPFRMA
jgi:hypothetical protein